MVYAKPYSSNVPGGGIGRNSNAGNTQWEYTTCESHDSGLNDEELNTFGKEYWELVTVTQYEVLHTLVLKYLFKRKVGYWGNG